MFDLEAHLCQWRRETEATLAFDDNEIDELEDHLKLAIESGLKEGLSPEQAWQRAMERLGPAPSLAVEFAKSKLMPALFHLVRSWWQAGLLILIFSGLMFATLHDFPAGELPMVLAINCLGIVALLFFLPGKPLKNAVLLGVGLAFCLVPFLYLLFYNSLTEKIVGYDWIRMGASFGWIPVSLSLLGIIVLTVWWWKRTGMEREKLPTLLSIVITLVFLLALSPFLCELIGNLSMRGIYYMPTTHEVMLAGKVRDQFINSKFVDLLVDNIFYVANILPFVLTMAGGLTLAAFQYGTRRLRIKESSGEDAFPGKRDLPWIMALGASGFFWSLTSIVEPPFSENMRVTEKSVGHVASNHGGLEVMLLVSAALFLICGYELTQRLRHSTRIRPFYVTMITIIELTLIIGFMPVPVLLEQPATGSTAPHGVSAQPLWLSWVLLLAVAGLACWQAWLIRKKMRLGVCEPSLWKFNAKSLVLFGLHMGLITACAGLVLFMVGIVMAFESVAMISALIAWGQSIQHPGTYHFDPSHYANPALNDNIAYPKPHQYFWIATGLEYVVACLIAGLVVAMILSALEFIRFNSFRFYKVRKAGKMLSKTLAVNE